MIAKNISTDESFIFLLYNFIINNAIKMSTFMRCRITYPIATHEKCSPCFFKDAMLYKG